MRLRAARRTAESAASRAVARGPTAKAQLFCKITAEQQQRSGSAVAAQAEQRQCRAAEKGTGSRVGKLSLGRGREKGISI